MSVNERKYDDEIDLLSLFETIWDGKWKIVLIVAVSLLSFLGFNIVKPSATFTATTEIKPITSVEFDKYILFNSSLSIFEKEDNIDKENKTFNIFEITPTSLLNSYIEVIEEGSLLETGIDKFGLINKEDFDIEILKPIKEKKEKRTYHILSAKYNDKDKWKDKWKDLLTFVNEEANKKVKASIISHFATKVSVEKEKKDFKIENLNNQIKNVKKDYEEIMKNRLAFLAEQALIARKLDIKKNIIQPQTVINTTDLAMSNLIIDGNALYLRGYEAIEEEIRLIKARKNKIAFMPDLYKLQQQKRDLEQDKFLERAVELFNKTPLNQNDFQATIVKVAKTNYKTNNKTNLYYALALVLGGMIGVVYVLIANAFRNRKNETVSL
ncbi:Wzz/FepE/Etk N-terminal domain-containing protein [Alphaproteobacteria bacterium]|nr:Wzz/FepE/Etk N-terminal domain-containing protein [Alphaproteobacteria bacterium]